MRILRGEHSELRQRVSVPALFHGYPGQRLPRGIAVRIQLQRGVCVLCSFCKRARGYLYLGQPLQQLWIVLALAQRGLIFRDGAGRVTLHAEQHVCANYVGERQVTA